VARYTLTERIGGKVTHERFDGLAAVLDKLERRGHELQGKADAAVVGGSMMRRFQPEDQVTARLEVSGPGMRAGLPPSLDGMYFTHQGQGAFWPAGELSVKKAGPVKIAVTADRPSALQRLLGVRRRVWLGSIAASPMGATRSVPLTRSCGAYIDHYTLSGYPR